MASEESPQIPADADPSHGKIDLPSSEKQPSEDLLVKDDAPEDTFPEGGARAWCVAAGTAGVTFCTLGYLNSFGYAPPMPRLMLDKLFAKQATESSRLTMKPISCAT
jgi:hypothetical protein